MSAVALITPFDLRDELAWQELLTPDDLGERADLTTYGSATTIDAPGGTFALATAAAVPVDLQQLAGGSRRGQIRLPSLAGALGIKACAVGVSDAPNAQLDDLIVLLSVVDDPREMRGSPEVMRLPRPRRPHPPH